MKKLAMKSSKSTRSKKLRNNAAPKTGEGKFSIHRVINWGDCDPAGMIYTPRVLDYACQTVDAWFLEELNASWWQLKSSGKGLGLPTVHAICDFISILRPDQSLKLSLYIREIGNSSIVFEVEGMALGDRLAFRVRLVSCAIETVKYRPTRIPDWMREKLKAYKQRCV
jgi:4-hydroxybenzoyl-CoA thioesterase